MLVQRTSAEEVQGAAGMTQRSDSHMAHWIMMKLKLRIPHWDYL